ncbi:hypothetical protein KAW38_04820 [Candidatus Micrarchaeota archaeon]|nr:hypothetical protein [Candidatus Micrarchaeota archaeon]
MRTIITILMISLLFFGCIGPQVQEIEEEGQVTEKKVNEPLDISLDDLEIQDLGIDLTEDEFPEPEFQ